MLLQLNLAFEPGGTIDGPPHDAAHQIRDDDGTTQALIELGYIDIRFHHTDDWEAIFGCHSDVFGAQGDVT